MALKKILLIRFSSIGDIVLTTPVIRCIKKQLKDVELHVVTKNAYQSIFASNPYVDKVYDFTSSLKEVVPSLRAEHYDYVVDLHRNLRSFMLKMTLHRPSATFPKLDVRKLLYTSLKINTLPSVHIIDRYFKAAEELGVVNDNEGLDFFWLEGDELQEVDLPEEFRNGFAAVVIGGQYHTKIFPEPKVVETCLALDYPIIILGGATDYSRGKTIAEKVGENIWNSCGKLTLGQSASVLKMADVVLTNDTGMMHIAAALHKPIVSIWGNTVPEFGMYPYLPNENEKYVIVECKNLKCRPCHKLGHDKCPKKHFRCMMDVDSKQVAREMLVLKDRFPKS